ncbi:flippase [Candidatus Bipolaricaulota bacterium]|nr:flippase [Candidatus Bipolaricaulota bacterium]
MALGIFIGAWVARYLGPANYGRLNYARSFVALFTFLSTLGLNQVVVRDLVKYDKEKEQILGTTFLLKLIGSVIMNITAIGAVVIINPSETGSKFFVVLVAFGYLFKSFDVIVYWFRSQVESKYAVFARLSSRFIINGFRVVLILLKAPLVAFVWLISINFFFIALGLILYFQNYSSVSLLDWSFSLRWAKSLLKDSWPLLLSGAAITIHDRIDQVMIGNMIGDEALGIYAAAARLKKWSFVAVVISNSVFPALIRTRENNKESYHARLQKLLDLLTWLAISFTVGVVFLSPFIIRLLYGAEYAKSSLILSILAGEILFNFSGVVSSKYLVAENLTKINLFRTIIGSSMNLVLNFLLIPIIGIVGSALSTLVSVAIQDYFGILLFSESRGLFTMYMRAYNFKRVYREVRNLLK